MWEMRISFDRKGLIPDLFNLLYPSECPLCGKAPDAFFTAPFCNNCWSGIEQYTGPACRRCATPLNSEDALLCAECLKNPPAFSGAKCFGLFEGTLATAIHLFKFQRLRRLHKPLGELLCCLNLSGADALIPVPLNISGLRERGFNQSLLIAKTVSKRTKIPLILDGLCKNTETAPQIGLSRNQRKANLKGAFSADRSFTGMKLLLMDDVMTTCSTANECSKELLKAGAAEVNVLTLARANFL
jgi:competence protein ComFC